MPSFYDAGVATMNPFAGYGGGGYGYAPLAPYGGGPHGVWPGWGYDIVGQAPPPAPTTPQTPADAAAQESLTDKGKRFLQKETFGVKNQNWLIGAAVVGLLYYGYEEEWFGKHAKSSSGDPRRHRRHHRRDENGNGSDPRRHHRRHHGRKHY
jgi:hypothetical protein